MKVYEDMKGKYVLLRETNKLKFPFKFFEVKKGKKAVHLVKYQYPDNPAECT